MLKILFQKPFLSCNIFEMFPHCRLWKIIEETVVDSYVAMCCACVHVYLRGLLGTWKVAGALWFVQFGVCLWSVWPQPTVVARKWWPESRFKAVYCFQGVLVFLLSSVHFAYIVRLRKNCWKDIYRQDLRKHSFCLALAGHVIFCGVKLFMTHSDPRNLRF